MKREELVATLANINALVKFMNDVIGLVQDVCKIYLPAYCRRANRTNYACGALRYEPGYGVTVCGHAIEKDNVASFLVLLENFEDVARIVRTILMAIKEDVENLLKKLDELWEVIGPLKVADKMAGDKQ